MKKSLLALMFLAASSSVFAAHFSVGIGVGVGPAYGYYAAPPPPSVGGCVLSAEPRTRVRLGFRLL